MNVVPRVLVVEDDDAIRALLTAALRREPCDVDEANDGAAALLLVRTYEYAVIILDLMMPRLNGFEFLEAFRQASPAARSVVFVVTAFDDAMLGKLRASQVHAIIRKPFDVPQLVAMVREVALTWGEHAGRLVERPAETLAAPASDLLLPLPLDEPSN